MAMSWTTLTGAKSVNGSIASWVNYTKLDAVTIVAEAESLLYSMLRVREMRTEWVFGMAVGQSEIALPSRFLEPIGNLRDTTNGMDYPHRIESDIKSLRYYDNRSGRFNVDAFATIANSDMVRVELLSHGMTQDSSIRFAGVLMVGGLDLNNRTFKIVSVMDVDHFYIQADDPAPTTAIGGGTNATYTADVLISGSPLNWTIWDEKVKFDYAFDTMTMFRMLYYRSPLPLSATNPTNWLTNRYPMLMRKACLTSAADFMKDDGEYQKNLTALSALVQSTAVENDMIYRGASLYTETP